MKQATPVSGRTGFTLVEILIVIVIIVILMGLVFKLTVGVMVAAGRAQTMATIEKVQHCLAEFYAEYGQYPPVPNYSGGQPVSYEYPWADGGDGSVYQNLKSDDPPWGSDKGQAVVFTFGLMSFLMPRYSGTSARMYGERIDRDGLPNLYSKAGQWGSNNTLWGDMRGDLERDLKAYNRWKTYLEGITASWRTDTRTYKDKSGNIAGVYTNWHTTVLDAWDRELRYESLPPYQSYSLWSVGPDGLDNTDDDINNKKWD